MPKEKNLKDADVIQEGKRLRSNFEKQKALAKNDENPDKKRARLDRRVELHHIRNQKRSISEIEKDRERDRIRVSASLMKFSPEEYSAYFEYKNKKRRKRDTIFEGQIPFDAATPKSVDQYLKIDINQLSSKMMNTWELYNDSLQHLQITLPECDTKRETLEKLFESRKMDIIPIYKNSPNVMQLFRESSNREYVTLPKDQNQFLGIEKPTLLNTKPFLHFNQCQLSLVATAPIPKDKKLFVYLGEPVKRVPVDARFVANYKGQFFISAEFKGNASSIINSSIDSNVSIQLANVMSKYDKNQEATLAIVTTKNIAAGEPIHLDYGPDYFSTVKHAYLNYFSNSLSLNDIYKIFKNHYVIKSIDKYLDQSTAEQLDLEYNKQYAIPTAFLSLFDSNHKSSALKEAYPDLPFLQVAVFNDEEDPVFLEIEKQKNMTALSVFSLLGRSDAVEALLKQGASTYNPDHKGLTALDYVSKHRSENPLHIAPRKIITLLVQYGAVPTACNDERVSPQDRMIDTNQLGKLIFLWDIAIKIGIPEPLLFEISYRGKMSPLFRSIQGKKKSFVDFYLEKISKYLNRHGVDVAASQSDQYPSEFINFLKQYIRHINSNIQNTLSPIIFLLRTTTWNTQQKISILMPLLRHYALDNDEVLTIQIECIKANVPEFSYVFALYFENRGIDVLEQLQVTRSNLTISFFDQLSPQFNNPILHCIRSNQLQFFEYFLALIKKLADTRPKASRPNSSDHTFLTLLFILASDLSEIDKISFIRALFHNFKTDYSLRIKTKRIDTINHLRFDLYTPILEFCLYHRLNQCYEYIKNVAEFLYGQNALRSCFALLEQKKSEFGIIAKEFKEEDDFDTTEWQECLALGLLLHAIFMSVTINENTDIEQMDLDFMSLVDFYLSFIKSEINIVQIIHSALDRKNYSYALLVFQNLFASHDERILRIFNSLLKKFQSVEILYNMLAQCGFFDDIILLEHFSYFQSLALDNISPEADCGLSILKDLLNRHARVSEANDGLNSASLWGPFSLSFFKNTRVIQNSSGVSLVEPSLDDEVTVSQKLLSLRH